MVSYKIKYKSYVADFYMPRLPSGKIVILIPGLPKSTNTNSLVESFLNAGCLVLCPSFSGSFDSGGQFKIDQCIHDVAEFVNWAQKKTFVELYYRKKIRLEKRKEVILVGMSFGAYICLAASHKGVDKLALLSPALLYHQSDINKFIDFDFRTQMESLAGFIRSAFPFTYREGSSSMLKSFLIGKTKRGSLSDVQNQLQGLRIQTLVLHGKKDLSIPWQITDQLRKKINNNLIKWIFPLIRHSPSSYNHATFRKITDFIVGVK